MERFSGALLGLACGDALGAPIEFMDAVTVRRRYGRVTEMIGGGPWAPGEWTDDTGMARCVGEGILEDSADPVPAAGRLFLEWAESAKDIGGTIGAALAAVRTGGDWVQASRTTPQARSGRAAGNGSLMRTLPVALAYAEVEALLRTSARLSAMTHWDPQAELCCALYCLWVRELLAGAPIAAAWKSALAEARRWAQKGKLAADTPGPSPVPETFWTRLKEVPSRRYEDLQPTGYAGYCVDCLEAAAWCCLNAESAEQAILDAVNLAGEADTIGAVAGGAAGAFWGAAALPERWLAALDERSRLEELGRRLGELRASL